MGKTDELTSSVQNAFNNGKSSQEIADYLGRTKQYIRIKILPHMSDVLQKRFSKENHPGQKYKAKD